MSLYKNPVPAVEEEIKQVLEVENELDYNYNKTVFFAFIDVLGFKNAFDENRDKSGDEDFAFAEKFNDVFVYYFELMSAMNIISKSACYAGQTSDSLYFYSPREDWLIEYIKTFLHLNLYAMSKDVFFRGGIAQGNLFIKEPYQFYGESVIYSYLLESDISKNPIIVIDEKTYQAIDKYPEADLLVKTDKNGRHYLNIYAPLDKDFSVNVNEEEVLLRKIDEELVVNNIMKNRSKFEYTKGNYEKYSFLLKEYEDFVDAKNKIQVNE